MSTEYVLHKNGPKVLALGEHSSVLDLYYWDAQGFTTSIFRDLTPEQVRDSLIKIAEDTAALLDIDGWKDEVSLAQGCSAGVEFGYTYAAPPADSVRLAEARKVAEYWRSLGMETRVNSENDPVVFGSGGPIQSISFSTGPGVYDVSGTSLCVPGDPDDYR